MEVRRSSFLRAHGPDDGAGDGDGGKSKDELGEDVHGSAGDAVGRIEWVWLSRRDDDGWPVMVMDLARRERQEGVGALDFREPSGHESEAPIAYHALCAAVFDGLREG